MHNRRIRGVVLGITATLGIIAGMAACTPPITSSIVNATGGVFNSSHVMMARLGIAETIGQQGAVVTRNDGRAYWDRVGPNSWIPGVGLEVIPEGTPHGPTGPEQRTLIVGNWYLTNRYFEEDYHMEAVLTVAGYGIHVSWGDCTLIAFFTANGYNATLGGASVTCTKLQTYAAMLTPADTRREVAMPAAVRTKLASLQRQVATLSLGGH